MLRVTGLCEGNQPVTSGFPSQMVSNAKNVSSPTYTSNCKQHCLWLGCTKSWGTNIRIHVVNWLNSYFLKNYYIAKKSRNTHTARGNNTSHDRKIHKNMSSGFEKNNEKFISSWHPTGDKSPTNLSADNTRLSRVQVLQFAIYNIRGCLIYLETLSASLTICEGIHRSPLDSSRIGPVMRRFESFC